MPLHAPRGYGPGANPTFFGIGTPIWKLESTIRQRLEIHLNLLSRCISSQVHGQIVQKWMVFVPLNLCGRNYIQLVVASLGFVYLEMLCTTNVVRGTDLLLDSLTSLCEHRLFEFSFGFSNFPSLCEHRLRKSTFRISPTFPPLLESCCTVGLWW